MIKTAPLDQNLKQIGGKHLKQTPDHQGYALPLTSVIPITPHIALNSHSTAIAYNLSNLQFSHYQSSPMEQPQGSALHTFITNPPKETASMLCTPLLYYQSPQRSCKSLCNHSQAYKSPHFAYKAFPKVVVI